MLPPNYLHPFLTICTILLGYLTTLHGQADTITNPSACGLGIVLTDNNCPEGQPIYNPDSIAIDVQGITGTALGVDVSLETVELIIQHEWVGDLDICLTSPGGQKIILTSDNGGSGNHYGNPADTDCNARTIFSASACESIVSANPPFTNSPYQPEQPFRLFDDGITNPNGIWLLQICDDVIDDAGVLEFISLNFSPISCAPVVLPEVISVDSTTVAISWDTTGGPSPVILEYGIPGFTPGSGASPGAGGTIANGLTPPLVISDLAEDSPFEVYLRSDCGGVYSINSCPLSFITDCDPGTITLYEDFDNQTLCSPICGSVCPLGGLWQNVPFDGADWIVYSGNTPTPGTGPSNDVDGGGQYIYLESSESTCPNGTQAFLYSDCILLDKRDRDSCHLSFNYHLFGLQAGSLALQISTNGGANWQTQWQVSGNQGNQWHKEYIGLAAYPNGATLQFRFVATKGSGSRSDIALDQIAFYGSTSDGPPPFTYYLDDDGDGFGSSAAYILSCFAAIPVGYADNDLDCNDLDPLINPGQAEIPCDGIDNNCNGPEDDNDLPPPQVVGDAICSGENAQVCAIPRFNHLILWYDSPTKDSIIAVGTCLSLNDLPVNNSPAPIQIPFYAVETNFSCMSTARAEVFVTINPNPRPGSNDQPTICDNTVFDLTSISTIDSNFTGGVTTWHDNSPPLPGNQLANTAILASNNPTYYFNLTNPAGCAAYDSITITTYELPQLAVLPDDSLSICQNGSANLTASATGGLPPYEYRWENGSTQAQTEVIGSALIGSNDSLGLTVVDTRGCRDSIIARLYTKNSVDSLQRNVSPVSACNGTDGSINLTFLDGTSPYQVNWSGTNGQNGMSSTATNTLTIGGLAQGSYDLTITDGALEDCPLIQRNILVNGPGTAIGTPLVTNVSCASAQNGAIALPVSGMPDINWSTGDTTALIQNLGPGDYSVTITNGACTSVLENLTIETPDAISLKADLTLPSCVGAQDGRINVLAFGGTAPYNINWNTGSTDFSLDNLTAGTYTLTLTDDNGCLHLDTLELAAPVPLNLQVDSLANISCPQAADAYIRVAATGGTGPYSYYWNNDINAPALVNLGPGNYQVTATDFLGCTITDSILIEPATQTSIALIDDQSPLCIGDSTGFLTVAAANGTAPYHFNWNTGDSTATINNLAVGTYIATAIDDRGCASNPLQVTLTATSPIQLNASVALPSCVGSPDARIDINPVGNSPFQVQWGDGSNQDSLTNITVGEYPLRIVDNLGCIFDTLFSLEAPQIFGLEQTVFTPSCPGSQDGIINTTILQSGVAPIIFTWNNGPNTPNNVGLPAGAYQLTVTDGIGCTFVSDTFLLEDPVPLSLQVDAFSDILCFGEASGQIETTILGGTPPYNISWLDSIIMSEDRNMLGPGEYRLQIEDARGCPLDTTFIMSDPAPLEVEVVLDPGNLCALDTLLVTAQASGGTMPYLYSWSHGDTSAQLVNPPANDYRLTVIDANGCSYVIPNIKVRYPDEPVKIDSFYVTPVSCFGANDGSATVEISGGGGDYLFQFNNSNCIIESSADNAFCMDLPPNSDYQVTVVDLTTGCTIHSDPRAIVEPLPLSIAVDSTRMVSCFNGVNGGIFTSVFGGSPDYTYTWQDSSGQVLQQMDSVANGLMSGVYSLWVTDSRACQDSVLNINLGLQNPRIEINDTLSQVNPVICKGDSTGSITLSIVGGVEPYTYEWSNGDTSPNLSNVLAGPYQLTITDAVDCKAIFPNFLIEEPAMGIEVSHTLDSLLCAGAQNASITTQVNGGMPPYTYNWYQGDALILGAMDSFLNNLDANDYLVEVEDSLGCTYNYPVLVPSGLPLDIAINLTPPNPPDNDGILMAIANTGTPPFSYQWSTGAADTLATLMNIGAGEYSITVTDANQCIGSATSLITDVVDQERVRSANVYPNPVQDVLKLDISLYQPTALTVRLFSAQGQQLFQQQSSRQLWHQQQFAVDGFSSGWYWLELRDEEERLLGRWKVVVVGY